MSAIFLLSPVLHIPSAKYNQSLSLSGDKQKLFYLKVNEPNLDQWTLQKHSSTSLKYNIRYGTAYIGLNMSSLVEAKG